MKNPCNECLVKSMCNQNCDELDKCIDEFIETFEKQTSIGIAAEHWLRVIEVRPRILKLWKEHGYKNNGRVA
jgi:peptide deformylase